MKILKLIILGMALFIGSVGKAQVSVNVNIGSPPEWGPAGYTDVRYYYLPDVEAYYDVQSSMFIYFGDGAWLYRANLPNQYRYYDLYSGYKVVMSDYRGERPYDNFKQHKIKYIKGYRHGTQKSFRENRHREKSGHSNSQGNNGGENKHGNGKSHEGGGNSQPKSNGTKEKSHGGGQSGGHDGGHGGGHGGGKGKK